MIDSIPQPESSLPEFLAARARHASDERLVADAVGGLLAAGAVLVWRIPGWPFVLGIGACCAAFGLWGIADREIAERTGERFLLPLRALRVFAVLLGIGASVFLVLIVLAKGLGRMIS